MPSNARLYEDSDNESLANELSPTDGYFNQRPNHPQDVMVPNLSLEMSEAKKAREARQEQEGAEDATASRRGSQLTTPPTPTRFASSRRRLDPDFEEDTGTEISPLLTLAPPTYSAATAGSLHNPPRSASQSSGGNINNGQYNTMARRDVFLPDGEPTDLSGGRVPRSARQPEPEWKKERPWLLRKLKSLLKIALIIVVLGIGAGLIANLIFNIRDHGRATKNPTVPVPGSDKSLDQVPPSCPLGVHRSRASFAFTDPSDFTFYELTRRKGHEGRQSFRNVRTSGEVNIRASTEHLDKNVRADVELHYSDLEVMRDIEFENGQKDLQIYSPSYVSSTPRTSSNPCVYLVVDLWISPRARLDVLEVQSHNLKIIFHEGLSLDSDKLKVRTSSGAISFPSGNSNSTRTEVKSRIITISTSSGSVSGTYPLYDILQIGSQSGSISIDIEPKDALKSDPKPAKLDLQSVSGTVNVNTPLLSLSDPAILSSSVPDRDYRTSMSSSSGGLHAKLIHGSALTMKASSGSVTATLAPYGDPNHDSHHDIRSDSGSVEVTVLSSLSDPGKALKNFYSTYTCTTGSLGVHYPSEWEGTVEGKVLSGSLSVRWPGIRTVKTGDKYGRYGWKTFKGVKGDGDGTLGFESVSGSVTLVAEKSKADRYQPKKPGHPKYRKPWEDAMPIKRPLVPPAENDPPSRWPGI